MRPLQDRRLWAPDRIHLTAQGHARVCAQALDLLGLGADPQWAHWAVPLDPAPAAPRREALRQDAQWVREYVVPWVGRRLRGRSSGDGVLPKRPVPQPVPVPRPEADGATLSRADAEAESRPRPARTSESEFRDEGRSPSCPVVTIPASSPVVTVFRLF